MTKEELIKGFSLAHSNGEEFVIVTDKFDELQIITVGLMKFLAKQPGGEEYAYSYDILFGSTVKPTKKLWRSRYDLVTLNNFKDLDKRIHELEQLARAVKGNESWVLGLTTLSSILTAASMSLRNWSAKNIQRSSPCPTPYQTLKR